MRDVRTGHDCDEDNERQMARAALWLDARSSPFSSRWSDTGHSRHAPPTWLKEIAKARPPVRLVGRSLFVAFLCQPTNTTILCSSAKMAEQTLLLDSAIRNWVLLPITIVILLVGLVRHNIIMLISNPPKKMTDLQLREQRIMAKSGALRTNHAQ